MRRRLWWEIFIHDIRMAEDDKSEPQILESQFYNQFPSNVNDSDLDPNMSYIPKSHPGKSDMLFSLVRLEVNCLTRQISFSDHFNEINSYATMSTLEKCGAIDRFEERIEREILSHCDMSIPFDFFIAESCRLILANLKLTVTKPRDRKNQQVLIEDNFRHNCVEILRRAKAMRLHERAYVWLWLVQSYIEWDALTYLFISLSLSPLGHTADASFAIAEDIYQYWNAMIDFQGFPRWNRIKDFHAKALATRQMVLASPGMFGILSTGTDQHEDCEQVAVEIHGPTEPSPIQSGLTSPTRSPALCVSQSAGQPESSMVPEQRFAQTHKFQNTQPAGEILDIPSSGTSCQWSAALFESYFEVLDSEQEGAISRF
ncbi:uncharacterized protein N7511_009939 [Penicillium nucicola]|uniref:uncharacterized protein n=1 Tax=Penicillium nucicola TaxID=1850975 RepID=UPI002544F35D|nr:uncharacterized protein N7511_009939 [Penicillium nucicola]KAJ5748243.1 hypothetical protein N7511_009939 [Penicillium nucicola]